MKKRLFLAIGLLTLILLAGGMGYLLGNMNDPSEDIQPEEENVLIENENDDDHVAVILPVAVVNLDEGIELEGERIFYAESIIQFPDTEISFLYTSLSDARSGVEQGRYAAYMIIPSTFSESIQSLNHTPTVATLTYVLSSDISVATQRDTLYVIMTFGKQLNNDVSLMYLANVLQEFHRVQDDSQLIMENDRLAMEAVNEIQGMDLIQMVQLPELVREEHLIENLDVSGFLEQNMHLLNEINETQTHQLTTYQEQLSGLQGEGQALNQALGSLFGEMNLTTGEDHALMMANGREILRTSLATYQTQVDERMGDLDDLITQLAQNIDDLSHRAVDLPRLISITHTPQQLTLRAEEVVGRYTHPELSFSIDYEEVVIDELVEDFRLLQDFTDRVLTSSPSPSTETVEEMIDRITLYPEMNVNALLSAVNNETTPPRPTLMVSDVSIFIDELHDHQLAGLALIQDPLTQQIESTLGDLEAGISEFERLDDGFKDRVVSEFGNQYLLPLLGNIETTLNGQQAVGRGYIHDFNHQMSQFNPNMDRTIFGQNMSQLHLNQSEMNQQLFENNQTHMTFANDVQRDALENVTTLQGFITEAMQLSQTGIEEGLQIARTVQATMSHENQTLLQGFTQLLPFTRIGTQVHTQAYQFMTNPIHFVGEHSERIASQTSPGSASILTADTVNHIATVAYLVVGGVLLTVLVTLLLRQKATDHQQPKETKTIS